MDTKKELEEIIKELKSARKKLNDLIFQIEEQEDTLMLDEAAAAISDAVELVEEECELR